MYTFNLYLKRKKSHTQTPSTHIISSHASLSIVFEERIIVSKLVFIIWKSNLSNKHTMNAAMQLISHHVLNLNKIVHKN